MTDANSLNEDNVVCPHCWHEFYADEAVYISCHRDLYGDPILGEMENRRFNPHEVQIGRDGVAIDPKGWRMHERGCPVCHLQIPPSVLAKRPIFISVVGAPRSGKTYFLTSMVHCIRKELASSFGLSLHDSDSHEVRAFLEYEKTLFNPADPNRLTFLLKTQEQGDLYNTVRLDGADVQLPKPFIFSLAPTVGNPFADKIRHSCQQNLVFYDNAGESFDLLKEKAGHIRVTQHLAQCDAVFFIFDPLQIPDACTRLAAYSNDPQVTQPVTSVRQETILQETVHRIRRHRRLAPDTMIPASLVVCVQKHDVWKDLLPHKHYNDIDGTRKSIIDHSSVFFLEKEGIAGLDVEEINRISVIIRSLMDDLCPEFVAAAEANFAVVRYFPISALGTSPELDKSDGAAVLNANMLKIRPINMHPFRVTHPLLWFLWKRGIIKRIVRRGHRAEKYAHAVVIPMERGRLRVKSPTGSTIFIGDEDYVESMIVDPQTGEELWIPRSKESSSDVDTPAPSQKPSASAVQSLKLNIDQPSKSRRRGWFLK